MKKVVVLFNFPSVNLKQYDSVWEDIRNSGNEHPKGLISHVGAPTPDGGLTVVDIWESREAFDEFGKILMPFIEKQNLPMAEPTVLPAHYVYMNQTQEEMA
jgi:hypothetical protein